MVRRVELSVSFLSVSLLAIRSIVNPIRVVSGREGKEFLLQQFGIEPGTPRLLQQSKTIDHGGVTELSGEPVAETGQ
jgi:hypothetical protein